MYGLFFGVVRVTGITTSSSGLPITCILRSPLNSLFLSSGAVTVTSTVISPSSGVKLPVSGSQSQVPKSGYSTIFQSS